MKAVQHCPFPDGGFVLHAITFASENGRFSAWFDAKGGLIDAEQLTTDWRTNRETSRQVKKDGPIWRMLRCKGVPYVKREVTT